MHSVPRIQIYKMVYISDCFKYRQQTYMAETVFATLTSTEPILDMTDAHRERDQVCLKITASQSIVPAESRM